MKKILGVVALTLFLILGVIKTAWSFEASDCDHFENSIPVNSQLDIESAFRDYKNPKYRSPSGDAIWLCFNSPEDGIPIREKLSLDNRSGLPVNISGLKLYSGPAQYYDRDRQLLVLEGINPVVLVNSSLKNCSTCLSINGDSFEVAHTTIYSGVIGIKIFGDRHVINEVEIKNCGIGIQIGDETHIGNNNSVKKVTTYDSYPAFAVVKGVGNFFKNSYIYERSSWGWSGRAIYLSDNANGRLQPPYVIPVYDEPRLRLRPKPSLSYSPEVKTLPEDGSPIMATFQFRVPYKPGHEDAVEVYASNYQTVGQGVYMQLFVGQRFYTNANLVAVQSADKGDYIATYEFPMRMNSYCSDGVVLFHRQFYGSSTLSNVFKLNGPPVPMKPFMVDPYCGGDLPGVIPAAEMDPPTGNIAPVDPGIQSSPSGISQNITDAISSPTPDETPKDKKKEEGEGIGATTPSGETTATEVSVGIGSLGAPGGFGATCSLTNGGSFSWDVLLIFLLPSVLFILRLSWRKQHYSNC